MALEVLPLHLATFTFPEGTPKLAGQTGEVLGFAVRHRRGIVLFDTGIGEGSELVDRFYRPVRRSLVDALADHDHALADVTAIVNSHLHFDHCGNNALLPGVPIYVQEGELTAARAPRYTVPDWVDFPGAEYRVIDGSATVHDGISVLATPGHTSGHQSVVVDAGEDAPVVLAGQPVYTRAEYAHIAEHRSLPQDDDDAGAPDDRYLASALTLVDLGPRRVHFSHDAAVWTG